MLRISQKENALNLRHIVVLEVDSSFLLYISVYWKEEWGKVL